MMGSEKSRRRGRMVELLAFHADEAVRLAYLLTSDRGTAEDLTRRAFLRILSRFQDLRTPDAAPDYLRQTIVNLARVRARRQRIRRILRARHGAVAQASAGRPPEERDELILKALPHRQRAALILRFYEGLSERESADLLGCSAATVHSLVSRGMDSMRAQGPGAKEKGESHLRSELRSEVAEVSASWATRERVLSGGRRRRRLLMAAAALTTPIALAAVILGFRALDPTVNDQSVGPVTDPVVLLTQQSGLQFELRGFFISSGEACYELAVDGARKGDLCVLPAYEKELAFAVARVRDLGKTLLWGWVADGVSTLEPIRADGFPVRDPGQNPVLLHSHPEDFAFDGRYFVAVLSGKKGTLNARAGDRRLLESEGWSAFSSRSSEEKEG